MNQQATVFRRFLVENATIINQWSPAVNEDRRIMNAKAMDGTPPTYPDMDGRILAAEHHMDDAVAEAAAYVAMDEAAAEIGIAPPSMKTFRQRMDEVVSQSAQLLNASRALLAAAEKSLQSARDALKELE